MDTRLPDWLATALHCTFISAAFHVYLPPIRSSIVDCRQSPIDTDTWQRAASICVSVIEAGTAKKAKLG